MLPLDSTTRKLQAFMSGAATTTNPTVTVSFYDVPNQTKEGNEDYRRAPQFTVLAGSTETDICNAPREGTVRHIEYINIYNADTVANTVTVCVDDDGTNRILKKQVIPAAASLQWTKDTGWQISSELTSGVFLLGASAVSASGAADTAENTLATITVPGGMMGANDYLEIHTAWSVTNNANVKTARVRFSSISGTEYLLTGLASYLNGRFITTIHNANSVSSQKGGGPPGGQVGVGTSAIPTSSVDTSADTTIVITAQKATSGDTMTLERYSVILVKV